MTEYKVGNIVRYNDEIWVVTEVWDHSVGLVSAQGNITYVVSCSSVKLMAKDLDSFITGTMRRVFYNLWSQV
jgi:hypothetical protein